MSSDCKKIQKEKIRLWRKNPHCENCGIKTSICFTAGVGKKTPPNLATIQHKYHKLHPLRNKDHKERILFLWCYNCNKNYQIEYEKDISHLNSMELEFPKKTIAVSDDEISEAWHDDFDFGEYYNTHRVELINNLLLHMCMRVSLGGIGKKLLLNLGLISPYGKITLKGKDYLLTMFYIRKNENKL
jgi:hypothetical protein